MHMQEQAASREAHAEKRDASPGEGMRGRMLQCCSRWPFKTALTVKAAGMLALHQTMGGMQAKQRCILHGRTTNLTYAQ